MDLCQCLNAMGARIRDVGRAQLTVEGVDRLHGTTYAVMPTASRRAPTPCAAAITGGDVLLAGRARRRHEGDAGRTGRGGGDVEEQPKGIRVAAEGALRARAPDHRALPGFATDMQAQFMAMLTQAAAPAC